MPRPVDRVEAGGVVSRRPGEGSLLAFAVVVAGFVLAAVVTLVVAVSVGLPRSRGRCRDASGGSVRGGVVIVWDDRPNESQAEECGQWWVAAAAVVVAAVLVLLVVGALTGGTVAGVGPPAGTTIPTTGG